MEYLFTIFHRLNTGGAKLNNQEIRNCIYGGSLNTLLHELDRNEIWRRVNRMDAQHNYRFVKQELMLRFFAFLEIPEKYEGEVARFLNAYMHQHRHAKSKYIEDHKILFERTVAVLARIFPQKPEARIPTSVMEAMLVAIGRNLSFLEQRSDGQLRGAYQQLRVSSAFVDEALAEGLSKKDKVQARLVAAQQIFSAH